MTSEIKFGVSRIENNLILQKRVRNGIFEPLALIQ